MKKLLFTLLLIPLFSQAQGLDLTLSLQRNTEQAAQALVLFLKNPSVIKARPVFSDAEKKILADLGTNYLAYSQVITVQDEIIFHKLKTKIRDENLPLNLDLNEIQLEPLSYDSKIDPLASQQWALNNKGEAQFVDLDPLQTYRVPGRPKEDLGLTSVRPAQGKKILVAVLDTGVQKNHPDLIGVLHRNESECRALEKYLECTKQKDKATCEKQWFNLQNPEVDQDQNGYPLDCSGWSVIGGANAMKILGKPDFSDEAGHGTHVAGIIGAQQNNGIGIKGISSNVEILPVQVISLKPTEPIKPLSTDFDPNEDKLPPARGLSAVGDLVARGVIYALRSKAQVINFSLGWPQSRDSQFLRQVIQEAQKRGVIIVAAAGNDSTRALLRPCAYSGVICVGAQGPDGALAHFSNYGSGVDISAPGTNILSTYPESKRPVRMRSVMGYEFLSGTSQATPAISGLVAEMFSRGFSAEETYSRLILGARPAATPLEIIPGGSHQVTKSPQTMPSKPDQQKFILSGNADLARALTIEKQALILPLSKERQEILWNAQSAEINWNIDLINRWESIDSNKVQVTVEMMTEGPLSVRPQVKSATLKQTGGNWSSGEVRQLQVQLEITDDRPERSRLPSDLELKLIIQTGSQKREVIVGAEIIRPLSINSRGEDLTALPIENFPKARTNTIPVENNFDGRFEMDYVLVSYQQAYWEYWLMTQKPNGSYATFGPVRTKAVTKNVDYVREQIFRFDVNQDGKPEYIIGIMDDRSGEDDYQPSPMTFFVFNDQFQLVETIDYDSKTSQIPYVLRWQQIGHSRRPVWLGPGKDPNKKPSLWDHWQNKAGVEEKEEIRLYYLNEKNQLQAIQEHQGYRIVDILEPTTEQALTGRVPLLLAKNRGTENHPSYMYDFAQAEFTEGNVTEFKKIDLFKEGTTYRNILDTRVDRILSLDFENEVSKGTYWFSEGKSREQHLSLLTHENHEILQYNLKSIRPLVDAALLVRTVFAGSRLSGAFLLTNSEIQYHDLISGDVVNQSMDRYSFFPSSMMTNMQFPILATDEKLGSKLPGLFTSEGSGLNKGMKVLVPSYSSNGQLIELSSPARFRLRAEAGCKPLDTPIWGGRQSASSIDYICRDRDKGDQIIRMKMNY
ncbi:MAG: hypothetical protein BroJett040_00270 [Oligoflexia bacterium]|nr:MAG: hypothetical protein BroJett040_00270 [Oligoflexia bacterium]